MATTTVPRRKNWCVVPLGYMHQSAIRIKEGGFCLGCGVRATALEGGQRVRARQHRPQPGLLELRPIAGAAAHMHCHKRAPAWKPAASTPFTRPGWYCGRRVCCSGSAIGRWHAAGFCGLRYRLLSMHASTIEVKPQLALRTLHDLQVHDIQYR